MVIKRVMDMFERLQKDFERDMEKAQKEFGEAVENVIQNADITIKR